MSAARALGWRVTVVDHRPVYIGDGRFPEALVMLGDCRDLRGIDNAERCHAAVVMCHLLASDVTYLRKLAAAGIPA